ncbi:MAG: hypothetical protein KA214_06750 [Neisseriaceae bacterium]|nr:hypothetical protein [Neisseriaceae bacterium]
MHSCSVVAARLAFLLGVLLPLSAPAATVCPQVLSLGPNVPSFTLTRVGTGHGDPSNPQAYAALKPERIAISAHEVRLLWRDLTLWPENTPEQHKPVFVTCHYDHGLKLTRHLTPTPQSCAYQLFLSPPRASSDLRCD